MHPWNHIGLLEILLTIAWIAGWATWLLADYLEIYLRWRK